LENFRLINRFFLLYKLFVNVTIAIGVCKDTCVVVVISVNYIYGAYQENVSDDISVK